MRYRDDPALSKLPTVVAFLEWLRLVALAELFMKLFESRLAVSLSCNIIVLKAALLSMYFCFSFRTSMSSSDSLLVLNRFLVGEAKLLACCCSLLTANRDLL